MSNIQVYKDKDLKESRFLQDYPINLVDEELVRRNASAMPHMRFLLNDQNMLELTFVILMCGPRVGCNITVAEKQKIEEVLEVLASKFFKFSHSLKDLKSVGKQIKLLSEEEIAKLSKNPVDYYRAKYQDGFKFSSWGQDN